MRGAVASAWPELLAETLEALESAGLRYCVLRGPATGTARARRREVDLLVDARDVERFGHLVSEIGFVPLAAWGYGGHHFYVAYEGATGEWLKLDVVTSLGYGGRSGPLFSRALAGCLDRRRRDSGTSLPDVADAMLGLVLHCLLDKGAFREDHRRELERLRALLEANDAVRAAARERFQTALGRTLTWSQVNATVADGTWESLLERRRRIAWELFRREPFGSALRWLGGKLARLISPVLVASRRRGFSVALLGPDGAGRTTLARALAEDAQIRARIMYMGSNVSASTVGLPWVEQGYRLLVSLVWRLRGRFVVFDRYPSEQLISGPARGWCAKLRRHLLQRVSVNPDLIIVLAPHDTSADQEKTIRRATSLIWSRYRRNVVSGNLTNRTDRRSALREE